MGPGSSAGGAAYPAAARGRNRSATLLFSDPVFKSLHQDWEPMARTAAAMLRMEAGRDPHDQRMAALVGELSWRDEDFRRWWGDHRATARDRGSKVFKHPVAGELTLGWDALTCVADPEQQLVVWTAEPGSPSHDGLMLLSSWAARTDSSAAGR
ncbi:hypothetical protein [Amycolatopsis australiensis]|uniref:MmyB-like transcription regulator ligand binding domain-containing protein n=1 Tax=Amycolatopsis australiensis TaxID=546364 RepID=A0A1K1S6W5_9PSEU|nr:hypothetical protein [Amycolatopsis australiensis]SFW80105.1 hypothetical protein SAMN04489730_4904 [Amycolatopsis australiensis]